MNDTCSYPDSTTQWLPSDVTDIVAALSDTQPLCALAETSRSNREGTRQERQKRLGEFNKIGQDCTQHAASWCETPSLRALCFTSKSSRDATRQLRLSLRLKELCAILKPVWLFVFPENPAEQFQHGFDALLDIAFFVTRTNHEDIRTVLDQCRPYKSRSEYQERYQVFKRVIGVAIRRTLNLEEAGDLLNDKVDAMVQVLMSWIMMFEEGLVQEGCPHIMHREEVQEPYPEDEAFLLEHLGVRYERVEGKAGMLVDLKQKLPSAGGDEETQLL